MTVVINELVVEPNPAPPAASGRTAAQAAVPPPPSPVDLRVVLRHSAERLDRLRAD